MLAIELLILNFKKIFVTIINIIFAIILIFITQDEFSQYQNQEYYLWYPPIFIPLGFLAGLYGMNFEVIPELKYPYGYFILIGIMATIAIVLMIIFRRKKWL